MYLINWIFAHSKLAASSNHLLPWACKPLDLDKEDMQHRSDSWNIPLCTSWCSSSIVRPTLVDDDSLMKPISGQQVGCINTINSRCHCHGDTSPLQWIVLCYPSLGHLHLLAFHLRAMVHLVLWAQAPPSHWQSAQHLTMYSKMVHQYTMPHMFRINGTSRTSQNHISITCATSKSVSDCSSFEHAVSRSHSELHVTAPRHHNSFGATWEYATPHH